MSSVWNIFLTGVLFVPLVGCTPLPRQDSAPSIQEALKQPLSSEEQEALLADLADNWFFGQGLGETTLNAGAVILFFPYGVYLAGRGIAEASGYQPWSLTELLPEEEREQLSQTYDSVTSGPGKFASALSGREFVTPEVAEQRIAEHLSQRGTNSAASEETHKNNDQPGSY